MDHGQEDSTILQHLSPLSVEFGRSVEGSSNNAQTTPHMHLGRMHNQASSGLYADNSVPDPIVLDSIASEALNAVSWEPPEGALLIERRANAII
jgi:hypothetical protein